MPFPEYIATRTLSAGGAATIESNRQLKIRATLRATKSLIWSDTGFQFLQYQEVKTSELGSEVTFNPPRTDLAGWKDYETKALIDVSAPESFSHRYLLLIEYLDEAGSPIGIPPQNLGPFVLPAGDGVYDIDKSVVTGTVAGDQVSIPDLWSQLVADAQASAAEAVAALIDSDAFIADKINDPESQTGTALYGTFVGKSGAAQTIDAQTTFTSQAGLRSSTWFGLGAGVGSARMPFYANLLMDGTTFSNTLASGGGDDYVGAQLNVSFQGGFAALKANLVGNMTSGSAVLTLTSGTFNLPVKVGYTLVIPGAGAGGGTLKTKIASITDSTHATLEAAAGTSVTGAAIIGSLAADHNFLFAANDFFRTGSTAGDLAGIDYVFGRLIEMHMYTPNATLNTIFAASVEAGVEASGAGSTIGSLIGLRVKGVTNHGGATITNVASLLVAAPIASGTAETFAINQSGGGKNMLSGQTTVGKEAAVGIVPMIVQQPLGATAPAFEIRDYTLTNRRFYVSNGGSATSVQAVTAYEGLGTQTIIGAMTGNFPGIRMGASGSNDEIRRTSAGVIESTGIFSWVSANVQTTVGATGSAAALPANPYSYLKVKHPDGTTLVVPAYRAA